MLTLVHWYVFAWAWLVCVCVCVCVSACGTACLFLITAYFVFYNGYLHGEIKFIYIVRPKCKPVHLCKIFTLNTANTKSIFEDRIFTFAVLLLNILFMCS